MTTNAELEKKIDDIDERVTALEPEDPGFLEPLDPMTVGPLIGKPVHVVWSGRKYDEPLDGVLNGVRIPDSGKINGKLNQLLDEAEVLIGNRWELCLNIHALEPLDVKLDRTPMGVKNYMFDCSDADVWDAIMWKNIHYIDNSEYKEEILRSNGFIVDETGKPIVIYSGNGTAHDIQYWRSVESVADAK